MPAIGEVTIEIVSWREITMKAENVIVEPGRLIPPGPPVVLVDGEPVPGCVSFTIDNPRRGIRTATLIFRFYGDDDRTGQGILAALARWGIKAEATDGNDAA